MTQALQRETGAVVLLVTVLVAVLLGLITVGITGSFSSEFRQTVDVVNQRRAFYAVQAGVEEAFQRIADANENGQPPYVENDGVDGSGASVTPPIFRSQQTNPDHPDMDSSDPSDPGATWIHRSVTFVTNAQGKIVHTITVTGRVGSTVQKLTVTGLPEG